MKLTKSRLLINLFHLVTALTVGLVIVAANRSQAAPNKQGSDATANADQIYLPSIFAADGSTAEIPMSPNQYASNGETAPDVSDGNIHASTYCSTYVKLNNVGTSVSKIYWENPYGQEILYNTLAGNSHYWQHTYLGQKWRVRDANENLLVSLTVDTCSYMDITIVNSDNGDSGDGGSNDDVPTPTPVPLCTGHISVIKFWDNETGEVVPGYDPIADGVTIDINTLPSDFYLRANPIGHDIASIEFNVNGAIHVENEFPFGYPSGGADWDPTPGHYTVTVTAYSQPDGQGEICDQETVTFTIVDPAPTPTPVPLCTGHISVVKFWNNETDAVVHAYEPLTDGAVVEMSLLPPNFYLRANPIGHDIASIEFIVNDHTHVENTFPFGYPSGGGDWEPVPGLYVVTVTAYSLPDGQGEVCDQKHLTFSIVDSPATPTTEPTLMPSTTPAATPEPTTTPTPTPTNTPPQPGVIGDHVFRDDNGNGLQDMGERGISGVEITLRSCSGDPLQTTSSDADGYYGFSALAAGCYRVQVTVPAGHTVSPQNVGDDDRLDSDVAPTDATSEPVNLAQDEVNLTVDVGLVPANGGSDTCIGDRVWSDSDMDGLQDDNEMGIGNVDVWLGADTTGDGRINAYYDNTQTDADGIYLFCGLDPAIVYAVEFVPPMGCSITMPHVGNDDAADSDADLSKGIAAGITVVPGTLNETIDAGFVCGAD